MRNTVLSVTKLSRVDGMINSNLLTNEAVFLSSFNLALRLLFVDIIKVNTFLENRKTMYLSTGQFESANSICSNR